VSETSTIPVAITSDDISSGLADMLQKLHAFHQPYKIPVTYFIVPCPPNRPGISQDPALLDAMRACNADGSEMVLHSYEHNLFEWGYPEIVSAMEFSTPACEAFADARFAIEQYHRKDAMQERLKRAAAEWTAATGKAPEGFRSGWGSFSGTLYEVLAEAGFRWTSLRFASRTSWKRCRQGQGGDPDYPAVINEAIGLTPYRQNGMVEYPILGDFGFNPPPERMPDLVELFKTQFAQCASKGVPCVVCHHHHGLESGGKGTGYEIYRVIFEWLKGQPVHFVTMSELHTEWQDRAIEQPVVPMPMIG